ncbi:glycosyltransferase family 4 protein [Salinilacihabitans rarus]|uniref:glycosyltransferase family 4 protein n=1 Tax=Salinilacihabitans rarus TaxID=2961596 RepID=UPI0020C8DDB9|nr:glycosyltransferase family 4 protein [Salinilacihabitans rarus]
MRVLHYLECPRLLRHSGIGTAADHQRTALSRLGERGVDVSVATGPLAGPPRRVPARLARGDGAVVDYDLAHCNTVGPGSLVVARHARLTGRPLVVHAHVTREDFRGSFRGSNRLAGPLGRYLRRFYSQADLVLCPSEHTKRLLDGYPVEAPVETVTNGVDLDALAGYERFREPYRERYDLEGVVVFTVGNVFERKGLSTFCRLARHGDREFVWFGPFDHGPLTSPTVRRWTRHPPANVTFTGWVENRRGAFAAGDVFLFPTRAENQGIAVLEAMACRKPVVLRDLPVFEEFFTDGVDCLTCASEREFREALDRLAADPGLRRRLGERARETAERHRLEVVGEGLVERYRRLLDRSR